MDIICYVPVRLNSSRLPRKNLKKIKGKPMFLYVVDELKKSKLKNCFYVNSPDSEIINICKRKGISYHKREWNLGIGNVTTEDIIKEFINGKRVNEDLFLINPTNPLVKVSFINEFVKRFEKSKFDVVASTNKIRHHLVRKNKIININFKENKGTQFLESFDEMNWLCIGIKARKLKRIWLGESLLCSKIDCVDTPYPQYLDVDTKEDLNLIRKMVK
jgi:CMP-N-acetylneuraminic acid synthetase